MSKNQINSVKDLKHNDISSANNELIHLTELTIAGALLLGYSHAKKCPVKKRDGAVIQNTEHNFADDTKYKIVTSANLEPVPFEEAIDFMQGKVSMTKKEWLALEPQLRFRAFTVARLAEADYIEAVRGHLVGAMQKGETMQEVWSDIKTLAKEVGANLKAGYWETVYRTNIQSAYSAGRLMQYKDNMPPAWELMILQDGRTSDTCKGIVSLIGNGRALPSNHSFWKTYGFPPYHFNCRTSFRAVYDYEIGKGTEVVNPSMEEIKKTFKPAKGFGGNTASTGSWWKLTDGMIRRAKKYGLKNEFDDALESVEDAMKEIDKAQDRLLENTVESSIKAFPKNKQEKVKKIMRDTKITINRKQISNYKNKTITLQDGGNIKTFLHEFGHRLDDEYKSVSTRGVFTSAFIKDKNLYVNESTRQLTKKGLKLQKELEALDGNRFNFIKDNIDALTKRKIFFAGSSRPVDYYKKEIHRQKEIFANLIQIQLHADKDIKKLAKKHTPKLYAAVAQFIKRM